MANEKQKFHFQNWRKYSFFDLGGHIFGKKHPRKRQKFAYFLILKYNKTL